MSFILYPILILLPNYLRQLPLSHRSMGQYTDSLAVIAFLCLFHWVRHRHRRCQYCAQYAGAGPLPLLAASWWEKEMYPSRCCCSVEWDTVGNLPPNVPNLVLPRLYCRCRQRPAYLFSSLPSSDLIIPHLFCCPHCLASLIHLC